MLTIYETLCLHGSLYSLKHPGEEVKYYYTHNISLPKAHIESLIEAHSDEQSLLRTIVKDNETSLNSEAYKSFCTGLLRMYHDN